MSRFATGVTVVTVEAGARTFGMTANAFMAGSLEPPLCVISIGRAAKMHAHVQVAGWFGVSFLSEGQAELAQHFAARPIATVAPRFRRVGGVPVLEGCVGAVAARVVGNAECGDHTLFLGLVEELVAEDHEPLLFYAGRYAGLDREQRLEKLATHSFW